MWLFPNDQFTFRGLRIPTCTASFLAADSAPAVNASFMAAAHTFFPSRCSALSSAGAFWRRWRRIAAGRRRRAFGDLERLRDPAAFARYLDPLRQAKWVVYAKPPSGGAPQVLEYLV